MGRPRWCWRYSIGRGYIRVPVAWYFIYFATLWLIFYAIPAHWGIGQELVSDIGREVSLLFQ